MIKTTQVSRFPDVGYGRSERMCLPTNLSKMVGFNLVDYFLLMTIFLHTIIWEHKIYNRMQRCKKILKYEIYTYYK